MSKVITSVCPKTGEIIRKLKQVGQVLPFEETQLSFDPFEDADNTNSINDNGPMDFQNLLIVICSLNFFRSFDFTYKIFW